MFHYLGIVQVLAFLLPGLVLALMFQVRMETTAAVGPLVLAWFLITIFGFIFPIGPLLYLSFVVTAAALVPKRAAQIGVLLIGLTLCLPAEMGWEIPFPGINYLIAINPVVATSLAVGGIAMLRGTLPSVKGFKRSGISNYAFLLFAFSCANGLFAWTTFTNELRVIVQYAISVVLVFLVLRRSLSGPDADRVLLQGILIISIFACAGAAVSVFKQWDFYDAITNSQFRFSRRGGLIRAGGQYVETLMGVLMAYFAFAILLFRKYIANKSISFGWAFLAGLVLVNTGSRAAILCAMALGLAYFVVTRESAKQQLTLVSGLLVAGFFAISAFWSMDLGGIDEYGTFDYRRRLIEFSWVKFLRSPLFGDPNYATDPFFDPLIQGQGIVDFVNAYVQVGLSGGAVGLALFLLPPGVAILNIMSTVNVLKSVDDPECQRLSLYGQWLVCLIASYLLVMATISQVSYIYAVYIMLLGIAQAYVWQTEQLYFAHRNGAPVASSEFDHDTDVYADPNTASLTN